MKSELSQTFVVLTGLLLLETGCAGHRPISASKPAPVPAGNAAIAGPNNPAPPSGSTTSTDDSGGTSGRETMVAKASRSTVGNVVTVSPPPPQVEVVGAAPGPEFVWMPGIWTWQSNWVWISGRWVLRPRPEARWVTGHWTQHADGWVWVRGYWR